MSSFSFEVYIPEQSSYKDYWRTFLNRICRKLNGSNDNPHFSSCICPPYLHVDQIIWISNLCYPSVPETNFSSGIDRAQNFTDKQILTAGN